MHITCRLLLQQMEEVLPPQPLIHIRLLQPHLSLVQQQIMEEMETLMAMEVLPPPPQSHIRLLQLNLQQIMEDEMRHCW